MMRMALFFLLVLMSAARADEPRRMRVLAAEQIGDYYVVEFGSMRQVRLSIENSASQSQIKRVTLQGCGMRSEKIFEGTVFLPGRIQFVYELDPNVPSERNCEFEFLVVTMPVMGAAAEVSDLWLRDGQFGPVP